MRSIHIHTHGYTYIHTDMQAHTHTHTHRAGYTQFLTRKFTDKALVLFKMHNDIKLRTKVNFLTINSSKLTRNRIKVIMPLEC